MTSPQAALALADIREFEAPQTLQNAPMPIAPPMSQPPQLLVTRMFASAPNIHTYETMTIHTYMRNNQHTFTGRAFGPLISTACDHTK